jgi:ABC-type transporter Mla subunit MlaD
VIAQDEALVRRVGLVALAVLVAVIAFFVFVFGRIEWGAHTRVHIFFHDVGALHEGAPFVVAGQAIGKVEAIALAPHAAALAGDDGVAVTVAIDKRKAARLDPAGDIFIASRGMLSDRYLELGPGPHGPSTTGLRDGQDLVGRDPPSLDRVLQRTWNNLQDLGGFVADIKPELDALRAQLETLRAQFDPSAPSALPGAAELAPLFVELAELSASAHTLRDTGLGGEAGMARLGAVLDHASRVVGQARVALAKLDDAAADLRDHLDAVRARLDAHGQGIVATAELAIDRVRADLAKVDPLLATLQAIQQSLARGEG